MSVTKNSQKKTVDSAIKSKSAQITSKELRLTANYMVILYRGLLVGISVHVYHQPYSFVFVEHFHLITHTFRSGYELSSTNMGFLRNLLKTTSMLLPHYSGPKRT